MIDIIRKNPIIAILRNIPDDILIPYVDAVFKGGIKAFEVAMNTPSGADQIKKLAEHFGSNITIGAGTVTTLDRIKNARMAGAQFYLTPSADELILKFCRDNHLKLLPGVMTPSDVNICLRYNYRILKLFPAGTMPLSYINDLKGPFGETEYVAVGGISTNNISAIFQSGYIGAGIGSSLIPASFISDKDWCGATHYIQEHFGAFL